MYLEDGTLHGKMGQHVVNGTTVIPEEDWTLMVMRYDAEGEIVAEQRKERLNVLFFSILKGTSRIESIVYCTDNE